MNLKIRLTDLTRLFMLCIMSGLVSLLQVNGQSGLLQSKHFRLEKLAEGVYAAVHNNEGGYAICNAGIIDLGDKTIVLDPFISPTAARDLKQIAEYLTGRPVTIVLNLDPHSDHTNGNQVFLPGAHIIGTPNGRKYIMSHFAKEFEYYSKNGAAELSKVQNQLNEASGSEKIELTLLEDEYKAILESLPELKMTLPDITICDTLIIYGSKRNLVVIPTGTGHTNGDMLAFLPDEKIAFMSDQLFVNCHPYLGDGDPQSLKKNLQAIAGLKPVIAVPGHGNVGNINSIYMMIDYIDTLTDIVKKEIQKGTDESKIIQIPMPEKYKAYLIGSFYGINLRFMYNKLHVKSAQER